MNKKIFVFLFVFIALFSLTGCYKPFTDINDLLDQTPPTQTTDGTTLQPESDIDWPKSSQSTYQTPVEIKANATESDIAEAYLNSTVTVFVTNENGLDITFGSGVCIYSGGYIATNHHVIEEAQENPTFLISVYLHKAETSIPAKLLWADKTLDLAIIQCQNGNIPYAKMADRVVSSENRLKMLEKVITIGTPIDFSLQNSCSAGYVSGLNRYSYSDANIYETLIQHTAPISHGNSGGPLFDMSGNLVGLNTLGANEGNSLFFAVPIHPIMTIIERVVALNEDATPKLYVTPTIGISLTDYIISYIQGTEDITQKGVHITAINSGGAIGNLLKGDIIIKATFNSIEYNIEKRNDLLDAILHCNKQDTIQFTILRGQNQLTINLILT